MPAGPGESLLSTVFADVHYYFNDPSSKPLHHRFDRGSYVYLFHNALQRQTKLEIANHAGTPDQDAFFGYLNVVNLRYTYLQPNLVTLLVNTGAVPDQSTWHLPTFDQRNEQKHMYKLHALDIYMWTEKDATTFVGHLKSVLSQDRLEIKTASGMNTPHSEHRDSMSPVVAQLERTAVGSHFPPRAASTVSAQSIPGPPTPAMSASGSPKAAPMGYNPAAPPAPEPITYREKTPPPPDDGTGTGLGHAVKYDSAPQSQYAQAPGIYHQNSNQTTPQNAYFSGPPQPHAYSSYSSTPSQSSVPPPPQQQQRAPSFGPMASSTLPSSPPPGQQNFNRQSSFGPTAQSTIPQAQYATYNPQAQYGHQPGTPNYNPQLPPTPSAPPAYSGPLQSPGLPPPPPQQQQQQQQAPVGGYSNYSYTTASAQQQQINAHGGYVGDTHSQVYRPTEAEASSHGTHKATRTNTGNQPGQPSKLQSHVGKGEAKVGKFLNKLDKLF